MHTLIIAEHDNHALKVSTLATIKAATALTKHITLLVIGNNCKQVAKEAQTLVSVTQILLAENKAYQHFLSENISALVHHLAKTFDYILAPATTFGKNILPRVAALLDVPQISEITQIISHNTFARFIYAGKAIEIIKSQDAKKVITVRPTAFDAIEKQSAHANIHVIEQPVYDAGLSAFVKLETTISERICLNSAQIIVSGGRGLQSAEKFKLLEKLADKLHAAIGASRAAVDANFVPNECQIGQTGRVVAPKLYFAIGISGAIQHLAGIQGSKVIVAINHDEDAPIFQIADYGIVGDLFKIVPELIDAL